jgi:5-methylcytosine-specific restriction enzyme A
MPMRPMRKCAYPRCPNPAPCAVHSRDRRPSPARRGYGRSWEAFAAAYKRENPLCRPCEAQGRYVATYAVDHITPVSGPDDSTFWTGPFQPLCRSCHSRKSMSEMRAGIGRDASVSR